MKRRFLFFFVITWIIQEFLSIKLSMDIQYLEKTIFYQARLTFLMDQNSIDGEMVELLSTLLTHSKKDVNPTPKFVRVVSYKRNGQWIFEKDAAFQLHITDATTSKVLFETKQWHSGTNTYFSLQEEKKWVKIIIDSISSDLKDITIVFTSSRGSTKVRLFHENNSHIKPSDTWVFDLTWYVPLQSMYYNGHSHEFGVKVQNLTDNGYMLVEEHFGNGLTMDLPRCSSTRYGPSCESHCYCDDEPCDLDTGHCTRGCRAGFQGPTCNTSCDAGKYGKNCSKSCHCYLGNRCDPVSGRCGRHGCAMWFTGPTCNISSKCGPRFFGKNCQPCHRCQIDTTSQYIKQFLCHRTTGNCLSGKCEKNFMGERCDKCAPNRYGRNCQYKCGKCLDDECHPTTGHCRACAPGYFGAKCDLECANGTYGINCDGKCSSYCADIACNFITGKCNKCLFGWKGEKCDIPIECAKGWYGATCDIPCHNCLQGRCEVVTGRCILGCIDGFRGIYCREPCPPGTYGKQCVKECGACSGWKPCNMTTGKCHYGCIGKFIPPFCKECPVGWFGPECDGQCGHCKGGVLCDSYVGKCPEGCAEGFMGPFCQTPIK